MADVFLAKAQPLSSAPGRRSFVKGLREIARAAVPKEDRRYKVGPLNRDSFKLEVPGGNGTVRHDGAYFDLDEPEAPTLSLLYALVKAGGMAMVEAGPGTILFDKALLKILRAELRRPKPVICSSLAELARMLGFSLKDLPSGPPPPKKNRWSILSSSRWGRLPGVHENLKERQLYVEVKPGECLEVQLNCLRVFIKDLKKKKREIPEGGGITSIFMHHEVRLPTGEVFIPWHVTGYNWRRNTDHLVVPTVEKWMVIARAFARQSRRRTGMIVNGQTLLLDTGHGYPLGTLESRYVPEDVA